MHLDQLASRIHKLAGSNGTQYKLGKQVSEADFSKTEEKLKLRFPEQVKRLYQYFDGLSVESPQLEILALEKLAPNTQGKLHFATFDLSHRIYFDVSHINEAGQWNIVSEDGYLMTMTIASFWSNKIWAWLERRREVWKDEPANCNAD